MALPKEILDAEWIKGNDHTMIRYADERKRIHIIPAGMNPYFFIKEEDLEKAKKFFDNRVVKVERGKYVTITGHKAVKISVRYPSDIKPRKGKGLRDILEKHGIETFESDIPFVRRWMIDNDIKQCKISWKCYVDIECDARSGFPDPNEAPFRVLSISVSGNDGKQYFFCDDDEKKMLKEFFRLIKKCYHMITGWNIRRFDWPYLINRAKKLGININFMPIQEIDAMLNYEKLTIWGFMGESYKLENVAKRHLGVDHSSMKSKMDAERLWQSFVTDRKELYEYNMTDADLVRRLDEKLQLCDPYIAISQMWPIMLRETPLMTQVIETMLLQEALRHPYRLVFPRKKEHEAELLGGMTLQPIKGLHKGVISLDFKSLYPTIIISFWLSPEVMYLYQAWRASRKPLGEWIKEVFNVECDDTTTPPTIPPPIPKDLEAEEKYRFWKKYYHDQIPCYVYFAKKLVELKIIKYPFMAKHLDNLLGLRSQIKKEMKQYPEDSLEFMSRNIKQAGIKLVLVSSYGVTGYRNTRFFNAEFVNATTGLGQTILDTLVKLSEKFGFIVIYGDTDSVFLKPMFTCNILLLPTIITEVAQALNDALKKYLIETYNIPEETYKIFLEPKTVFDTIIFTQAKKKYIGEAIWNEGMYERTKVVVGFEAKRSDAFQLMKEVQENIVNILATAEMDKAEAAVERYLAQVIRELFEGKHDDKLILEMTVRKSSLDKYESDDPHVRVAKKLKEMNLFRPGDRVRWIVVAEGKEEPVIPGRELPKPTVSGYKYYIGRIMDMVERLLGYKPEIAFDGTKVVKQARLW